MKVLHFPDVPFSVSYIPQIMQEIYIHRVYDEIFSTTQDVVLDCGANCGLASDYFRQHAKKVYSFEPDPEYFTALELNKKDNNWDNVEVFNKAISNGCGEATFHVNDTNRTASSLDNPFYDILKGQHQYGLTPTVKVTTLEDFIKAEGIEKVDFLKLDIEGQEDLVLTSPGFAEIAPKIKTMLVEFHNNLWERTLYHVEQLGFTSKRLDVDTVNYLFRKED